MGTNSGEPGASSLEAERIRSRVASMGGCVKLKTVTQIRQSSAGDTFIAVSAYLVLNSLLYWDDATVGNVPNRIKENEAKLMDTMQQYDQF